MYYVECLNTSVHVDGSDAASPVIQLAVSWNMIPEGVPIDIENLGPKMEQKS